MLQLSAYMLQDACRRIFGVQVRDAVVKKWEMIHD
jgi:hypothetical protein